MSHRQRDDRGFVMPKAKARPRTKLRWAKRHMELKQIKSTTTEQSQVQEQSPVLSETIDTTGFKGMKKVDL